MNVIFKITTPKYLVSSCKEIVFLFIVFLFQLCHKGRVTTTANANYCRQPTLSTSSVGGNRGYPEKTHDFRQSEFLVRSHSEYNTNLALWSHHVIISTNEDPSLRIESFAIINLLRVLTYSFHMRTELKRH